MGIMLLCISYQLHAQVVINEYSAANKSQYADATGAYEDWIEIYNAGSAAVNIGGWHLSDNRQQPLKWTIPNGVTLNAGARRIFICDSRDGLISGQYHTNFKLTQSNYTEEACLTDVNGTFMDSIDVLPTRRNHSRGRVTDGAATWGVFESGATSPYGPPTPGTANSGAHLEYVPQPVFSLAAGFYTGTQSLTLTCSQANTSIYYTTNGAIPTNVASGTNILYTGPISLTSTKVVRARAFDNTNAHAGSFTVTNTIFINEPVTTFPIWSIAAVNMSTGANNFFSSGNETLISMEYFGANGQRIFQMEGDVRKHGNDSWNYAQKGMRLYVRDEYGYANKIDYKMFPTSPRTDFDVIILKAAGSDNYPGNNGPSAYTRDAYVQTLSEKFNLNLDVRRFKNAITYINGQYWGVYESRERIDKDYTDYYYNNDEKWVDMLAYWGGMQVEEGSDTAWNNLFNYIVANPMTNQNNYNYVMQRFNGMSLIDYFVLNTYTVNSDWLNWNTAWWRGRRPGQEVKWRYRLWDQDNTFDLGENFTGLPETDNTADPCDVQGLSQYANTNDPHEGHVRIFNKLMTNPGFKQMYVNRYADLINTAFYCPNMLAHWDTMIQRLQPEMQRQCTRWSGSYNTWMQHVNYTRSQISGRCNNVQTGLGPCYQLTGPYPVKLNVSPACAGTVTINSITPDQYPFTGNYYGGINITLDAHPATGWQFSHWQLVSHTPSPNVNADSIWLDLGNSGDSIVAVFTQINPTPGQLHVVLQGNNPGAVTINGTPVTNGGNYTYTLGSQLNVAAVPIAGCTFSKWLLNHTLVNPVDTLETGYFCFRQNDTLTVVFDQCNVVPDSLTVIIQQPGYGTVTINNLPVPAPVTIPMNAGTLLNLVATPIAGYTFSHWQLAHHTVNPNNNTATGSFTFNQRDTLIAVFLAPDTFNLTVVVNPSGSGNVNVNGNTLSSYPTVLQIVDGTVVNLQALANTGFTFTSWVLLHHTLAPNTTSPNVSFTITQNDTLVANFTATVVPPDTFTLTLVTNPLNGGTITANGTTPATYPTTLQFVSGTLVNVAATANTGFTFTNWLALHHTLSPNSTSANASFVITQNDTLVANFTGAAPPDTFSLTILVNPAGGGNVDVNGVTPPSYPTVMQFVDGTVLNVSALPTGGYTFANWLLLHHTLAPNNTSATASFTITANDTLIANFNSTAQPDTFALTVLVNPGGGGNVSVNGTTPGSYPAVLQIPGGNPTAVTATPTAGYNFTGWSMLHHSVLPNAAAANATFTLTQNDTLVANFVLIPSNDSVDLTVVAFPGNGGNVVVNGNTVSSYPSVLRFQTNTSLNIAALPNPTFAFAQWHVVLSTPNPSNQANPINFVLTQSDTVYAYFLTAPIPDSSNLTIIAVPDNGGSITVNGNLFNTFPSYMRVRDTTVITSQATANPNYYFEHWELVSHTPLATDTSQPMTFTVMNDDTIFAHFARDSFEIVVAKPIAEGAPNVFAGTVTVAGTTVTAASYPKSFKFAAGDNVDFEALGRTFTSSSGAVHSYTFDHYEFVYHNPIYSNYDSAVYITVQESDTVTVFFVEQLEATDTSIQVWLPTAFAPDGVNNQFRPHPGRSEILQNYNMQIYNRWGQKVFESNNQGNGWSGLFNGKKCDIGVYSYVVSGKRGNGDDVLLKGTVTLIR
ncbi:MAG: CotH kinase family protein [Bacteroidetes bacterium]|nr:CotH kinase family protein [Bacteroidota bacterium]